MLKFYVGGEQDVEYDLLAVNLYSNEDAVSPEYVMESIIDSLLGMSTFLDNNHEVYKGILADFSIELPEGHNPDSYTDVPAILKNMEHQKVVDFYDTYCNPDCFEHAQEDAGCIYYSFILYPPSSRVNEDEIWEYYKNNII